MAKTIEELAKERFPLTGCDELDHSLVDFRVAYMQGAYTVIDEIKSLLLVSQIHSYHEVYNDIVKLVKQLKGEQQ